MLVLLGVFQLIKYQGQQLAMIVLRFLPRLSRNVRYMQLLYTCESDLNMLSRHWRGSPSNALGI